VTTPTREEALDTLEQAWTDFYEAEIDRIDDDVAFLTEVREGISGSGDLSLATIGSAEPFLIQEVNLLLGR